MKKLVIVVCAVIMFGNSCSKKNENVDTEYPTIDITAANAFPQQCGTIQKGQTITLRFTVKDNLALGSAGVDVHQNFDHHNHSTEIDSCPLDPVKKPVNPFTLIKNFAIPEGKTSYVVEEAIAIPADIDEGDYHFLLKVTDKSGWQTIKGLSVKIK